MPLPQYLTTQVCLLINLSIMTHSTFKCFISLIIENSLLADQLLTSSLHVQNSSLAKIFFLNYAYNIYTFKTVYSAFPNFSLKFPGFTRVYSFQRNGNQNFINFKIEHKSISSSLFLKLVQTNFIKCTQLSQN